MEKVNIGVIGCGNISGRYFTNCKRFKKLEIVACADLISEKAKTMAKEYNIPKVCTVEEILESPDIEIVLNITTHKSHADVCLAAIKAGKNVYVEKPLGITREEGQKITELAKSKGVLIGAAPDTFLGGGLQTCRKLIDEGWIGKPLSANAFQVEHLGDKKNFGVESWHPDPEHTYNKSGGGPLLGMSPYYITALVFLLGPIKTVAAFAKIGFPERIITSQPKYGQKIKVQVPTHVSGILKFTNNIVANFITSFDIWESHLPYIEIYGSEGALSVPDPNTFGGPVSIFRPEEGEWKIVPIPYRYTDHSRGVGLLDMAYALHSKRKHRANGELAYHVLDVIMAFDESSSSQNFYEVNSTCLRPEPLPLGLIEGELDE